MGLFDKILKDDESLFKNELALDYEFIPKEIPHRENQQHYIADCISPLFNKRNGKHLFVCGSPGIGKTVAIKHIFKELEEKTDEIIPIYVNCWKKDTSYKILVDMCEQIGYKWVHNKRTDELMKIVSEILNKKSAVICLDEVDKVKEVDIIYSLCEDIFRKTILVVANNKKWISQLDQRIKSRLMADYLEFEPYTSEEVRDIIIQRKNLAFFENVWENDALNVVVMNTTLMKDIRSGLFLLKESGTLAENKASRIISSEYVNEAVSKLDNFKIKDMMDFGKEEQDILELIKANSGKTIKELYDLFEGDISYRTFHRKIEDLKKNKMINFGDKIGKSLSVNYSKKIIDY